MNDTNYDLTGGNPSKPFKIEGNFSRDVASIQPSGMGEFTPQKDNGNVANEFGQRKYARREGAVSIYKDETRNTANDNEASAKAEGSTVCEPEGERRGEEDY
jgi:hypothetical protein